MTSERRISRFWLEGGKLTDPSPEPEPRRAYVYGLDTATQTVRRFTSITGLVEWMSEADGRERVASSHAMVKKYRNLGAWMDEGDDHG